MGLEREMFGNEKVTIEYPIALKRTLNGPENFGQVVH